MRTPIRSGLAALAVVGVVALSGCSLLSLLGPDRDSNGRVTSTTEIDSTTLLRGDCFSFVDGTDLARAKVTPCAQPHTYLVIGGGTVTPTEVDKAGGLQNAVSVACADDFESFKKRAPEGSKPEQKFIVSPQEKDGKAFTLYLCVATNTSTS
jgi:hypothetical protein